MGNAEIFISFLANLLICGSKHVTLNLRVPGSSPGAPTNYLNNLAANSREDAEPFSTHFPQSVLFLASRSSSLRTASQPGARRDQGNATSSIASTSFRLCPVNVAISGTVAPASARRTTADPRRSWKVRPSIFALLHRLAACWAHTPPQGSRPQSAELLPEEEQGGHRMMLRS
jgi:hypothetical protein